MMWTILDTATGEVIYPCFHSDIAPDQEGSGWAWEPTHQAVEISFAPDPAIHSWDGTGWAVNLDWAKKRKRTVVNAYRDARRYSGCETPKGRMQTDPDSQRLVNGAVTMAMLAGDAFSIDWTMEDNTIVTHNAAEMQAAGLAVGQYDAQCHAIGQQLQAQIEAATTTAELDAIDPAAETWPV